MSDPRPRVLLIDLRALAIAAGVGLALGLLWSLRSLLPVMFFTGLLTLLGAPVVAWLKERFHLPRGVGAGLFVALALALVGALAGVLAPQLIEQMSTLLDRIPELLARAERALVGGLAAAPGSGDLKADLTAWLGSDGAGAAVQRSAPDVFGWFTGLMGAAGRGLLVPVLTFFLLTDLPRIARFLRALVPDERLPRVKRTATEVGEALTHMLRGQLVVALAMAVTYGVGLTLSGVPLSLAIAVVAGLAYFIPFASGSIALGLSVIFVLLEPGAFGWTPLLGAAATAAVAQALEAWVLTPRVVGGSVGLPPFAVVLAVLVGGALGGFTGVLLSLPVAAVMAALWQSERDEPDEDASDAAGGDDDDDDDDGDDDGDDDDDDDGDDDDDDDAAPITRVA